MLIQKSKATYKLQLKSLLIKLRLISILRIIRNIFFIGSMDTITTKNPIRWKLMRFWGRFNLSRMIFKLCFKKKKINIQNSESLFNNIDLNLALVSLKKDGIINGFKLPDEILKDIYHFSMAETCIAFRRNNMMFKYENRLNENFLELNNIHQASYRDILKCDAINKIANDPKILSIAQMYLNSEPKLLAAELWWNFSINSNLNDQNKAAQLFHFDLDDFQFIKFFFYISEVDEDSGPHVFILGSHKKKKFFHKISIRRYSDKEIYDFYGKEKELYIYGKAGEGFAEDTFGIHKGTHPRKKDRLLLQLLFGINDFKQGKNVY